MYNRIIMDKKILWLNQITDIQRVNEWIDLSSSVNIFISRFSKDSDMVELNPETGAITWTRELINITEDMDIQLIVIAEDHGTPPLNDTGLFRA